MSTSAKSIAIIIGSTRNPRVGPSIAAFVASQLQPQLPSHYTLSTIDLAAWNLPFFDEPVIPAQMPAADPTSGYKNELTRAWSTEIRKHNGFILVTPQYNWGYPAPLKNALDYLYHEWAGKPVMVVSYGSRGGGKAAEALVPVLGGSLHMKTLSVAPGLPLGKNLALAGAEGKLVEGQDETWVTEGYAQHITTAWQEMVGILNSSK